MRIRIIIPPPEVPPFDRFVIKRVAPRAIRGSHPKPGHGLDRPPDGETIFEALKVRTSCAPEIPSGPSRRILVVEDDADLRQVYVQMLGRSGYQVDTAEDGEAGWKALHTANAASGGYALLITDNKMPRLSGVDLIRKMQATNIHLPVILASGAMPEHTDRLHVASVLPKPFTPDQLIQAVRNVLREA